MDVCARVGECMRLRACECGCGCKCAGLCWGTCNLNYSACNAHARTFAQARVTLLIQHETRMRGPLVRYVWPYLFSMQRACVGLCSATCNLIYSACNAHATVCLRPLWLHRVFRHFLINGTIVVKTLLSVKCVFLIFCTTLVSNIPHSKKN